MLEAIDNLSLMLKTNQTFILFTYGEMWLLNKISCEIQILNEKVGKLMMENSKLEEENKRLQSENDKQKTELTFYKQSKIIDNETLQIRQKEKMRYKEILDRIKELYEYEEEAELLNYLDEILDEI